MKRDELFLFLLTLLVVIFNSILLLIGETRVDTYIMIFILLYLVLFSIFGESIRSKHLNGLAIVFIVLFLIISAYRIWRILNPESHSIFDVLLGGT